MIKWWEVILIMIVVISLFMLAGGSYKPLIYRIFNDYGEECYIYDTYVERVCIGSLFNFTLENRTVNICLESDWWGGDGWRNITSFNLSNCLEYHLVRKAT